MSEQELTEKQEMANNLKTI